MSDEIEWPREIWMAERDDHDQGVVSAVLSEHATVARFDGDTERDREFHRYVDADIYETAEKYFSAKSNELRAEIACLQAQIETAKEALQPFAQMLERYNLDDHELISICNDFTGQRLNVSHRECWNRARAALKELENTDDRS